MEERTASRRVVALLPLVDEAILARVRCVACRIEARHADLLDVAVAVHQPDGPPVARGVGQGPLPDSGGKCDFIIPFCQLLLKTELMESLGDLSSPALAVQRATEAGSGVLSVGRSWVQFEPCHHCAPLSEPPLCPLACRRRAL